MISFSSGSNYITRLCLSAKYGYEYVFEELYKRFKKKIYCPNARLYQSLPHISQVLTNDPTSTQIFAGFKNEVCGISVLVFEKVLSTLFYKIFFAHYDCKLLLGSCHYSISCIFPTLLFLLL